MQRFHLFLTLVLAIAIGVLAWQLAVLNGRLATDSTDVSGLQSVREELREIREDFSSRIRPEPPARQRSETRSSADALLSDVTLTLRTPDGRPLPGFEVELESDESEARTIRITEVTDEQGSINRKIPYGKYDVRLSEPGGWYGYREFLVAFDQPQTFEVIGPDPNERATVNFTSNLDPSGLQGLHFGELRQSLGGNGWSEPDAPAPGEESERFSTFPTPGNGITEVAAYIELILDQTLDQPDGTQLPWRWNRAKLDQMPILLITAQNQIRTCVGIDSKTTTNSVGEFFTNLGDREWLGYLLLDIRETRPEYQLKLGTGQLRVSIKRILGRLDDQLANDLVGLPPATSKQLWLTGQMDATSPWLDRFLTFENWERGESIRHHAIRSLDLKPDDDVTINLASPQTAPE
ncbi:carboxypeptidase-like regulatory domain-containing protein [Rubinisphaera margarita]|uniref:carboxypeptidase-like regulatory domain-containing protein n=1 Tax=Rubinisphaera margarita TaxID=2909586 RepID=UPI001EE7FE9E|nr:carboxypeptidase-like regulatory domain-containing protein [Rubinisphaera margarita]MCG6154863.1 carboxypeptidase-like regulatory domain-containing protein [Rubinisphaera margarita]